MSTFGACLLATLLASIIFLGDNAATRSSLDLDMVVLIGIGAGCLLAGLAVGASARVRPLFAAFLGGGLGVVGFFALVARSQPEDHSNAAVGLAVLAVGGAIVTLIGTLFGWVSVGRRQAT